MERLQDGEILPAYGKARAICIDLAQTVRIDPAQYFYDPVRTAPQGSQVIAEYLYPKLKDLP